jgi:hypothetical protein
LHRVKCSVHRVFRRMLPRPWERNAMRSEQTARRPMSYAGASDTGPCEGRQASPSNPTGAGKARAKEPLTEAFVFRCTATEKAELRAKAATSCMRGSSIRYRWV